MPASKPLPWDWRDAAYYAPLLRLERTGFAWEWLRRDPDYRQGAESSLPLASPADSAVERSDPRAARWGLVRFEPPDLSAPAARPLWLGTALPRVLPVSAGDGGEVGERFELERFAGLVRLGLDPGGPEHLLLSNGLQSVRLDVISGSLRRGPAMLSYHIAGVASAEPPLLVLRQLIALCRTGRFAASLHPADPRAPRWVTLLRVRDALVAGADQRTMAEVLLAPEAGLPRWRVEAPSLRSRVQRLVRQARLLAAGGYLQFLGGNSDCT